MKQLVCNAINRKGKRCGYKWTPRVERPKECPKCTNRRWDAK